MSRPARNRWESLDAWLARVALWFATPEGEAELAREREETAAQEIARQAAIDRDRLLAAGIPEKQHRLVAAPEPTRAVMATSGFRSGIMVLSGGTGCGKTTAACVWVASIRGGVFEPAGRLSRRSHWDETTDRLMRCSALAIDDLGVEYQDPKGFFAALLDELIDSRYGNDLPTLITTNLSAVDFSARVGARISSRIAGSNGFVSIADGDRRRGHVGPLARKTPAIKT